MKALSVAFKDVRVLLKNRGVVIELFVLPLLFAVVFSGVLGMVGKTGDRRITLPVVDLDGGASARALIDGVDAAGGVRIERYDQQQAMSLLDGNKIARVLIVPAGFTASADEGRPVALRLVNHPKARPQETEVVRLVVDGVARDMSLQSQLIASLRQMGAMQADAPEQHQVFTTERIVAQARSQFERAQAQPLVALEQRTPQQASESEVPADLSGFAVTGVAIMFVFLTAQTTARSFYEEKKTGSFRRLLAAPLSKPALLAGKLLPNFIAGLIQVAVILAFGTVGLRLLGLTPVPVEKAPLGVALVAVAIALCSSALGLVIAALARTENQIGGLSGLLLWGVGILGAVPLFILDRVMGPLPKILPHYWANRAFDNLLVRGADLSGVTTELLVLLGITVIFLFIGLWRFDFE